MLISKNVIIILSSFLIDLTPLFIDHYIYIYIYARGFLAYALDHLPKQEDFLSLGIFRDQFGMW